MRSHDLASYVIFIVIIILLCDIYFNILTWFNWNPTFEKNVTCEYTSFKIYQWWILFFILHGSSSMSDVMSSTNRLILSGSPSSINMLPYQILTDNKTAWRSYFESICKKKNIFNTRQIFYFVSYQSF